MKHWALDLCCGKGGWGKGLKKAGWQVLGVDIEDWKNPYNDQFIQGSVLDPEVQAKILKFKGRIKLVCASPPCQEFSYASFPFKKCKEKFNEKNPPSREIWDACARLAHELGCPLILENVQGARKYMGKAAAKYGSFYLWGDVPALLPIGAPKKGFGKVQGMKDEFGILRPRANRSFAGEMDRVVPVYDGNAKVQENRSDPKMSANRERYTKIHGAEQVGHHKSNARKEWSAKIAMIPDELSEWIGQCFYPSE